VKKGFAGVFVFSTHPRKKFWSSFFKSLRFPKAEPLGASVAVFFPCAGRFRPLRGRFLVLFLRLQPPKKERRNLLLTDFAGAFVFRRRPLEDANCYIFKKIKKSPFI
jgi:hypothetical protein